ncbi:MAG: esterase family protein [Planctomycetaceae bacterium]|nr:esterase family protein [Planctomycetaceae bacterium]
MMTGVTLVGPHDYPLDRPYNVCYLLHGLCGSNGDWANFTLLPQYAQQYHTIFVLPEVGRSFYTDMAHGPRYFSYVADELPDTVRSLFNVSAERDKTAVIGASMGGYGALKCALSRPERFGKVAAFSSACLFLRDDLDILRSPLGRAKAEEFFGKRLPLDMECVFGESFAWSEEHDIPSLAGRALAAGNPPDLFLACGESDYLVVPNRRLRDHLAAMHYPVTYQEWLGEHNWFFFNTALEKALAWLYGTSAS